MNGPRRSTARLRQRIAALLARAFPPPGVVADANPAEGGCLPFNLEAADPSSAAFDRSLREATADFNAVLKGKVPIHARLQTPEIAVQDGGTTHYRGNGYRLTVLKSLNNLVANGAVVPGYVYGPIVDFDPKLMSGNRSQMQCTLFYSREAMARLLSGRPPTGQPAGQRGEP